MITMEEGNVIGDHKSNTFGSEGGGNIFQSDILDKIIPNRSSINQLADKKQSILTMKEEWTTYSSIGVQREILERNTKIITDFMNSLAVPSWYRGLSLFQKQSADLLLNAIRDDCAQRTVYRTMRCLDSIGLDPLPTKKQLHTMLPLCGGSDLALLWFLMEWLYRDNESDSYSVNEQLIMSSIAHLDMNTTLRELDRILPRGQAPKAEIVQTSRKNLSKRPNKIAKHNNRNGLPYFEKLRQPRLRKINYFGTELKRSATFDCYQHQLTDSSHVMANESNRWFQGYNMNDTERTIRNFAKDEITRLLNNFEAAMFDENKVQTMYRHRAEIDHLRNSFDAQLEAITKRKIQEMGQRKHQNYKRTINRLQRDIEKFRQEFHTMVENSREHCSLKLLTNSVHDSNKNNIDSSLHSQQGDYRKKKENVESSYSSDKNLTQSTENESESKYFVTSQVLQPFKFDYWDIFAYKENHSEVTKMQASFLDAVDSDTSQHSPFESYSSEAFGNDIHRICQQKLTKHEIKHFTGGAKDSVRRNIVDYGLDYYDPEDEELMDRMLRDALDIMKNDHKFVFASIPAAHRFPMLREWIRLRYGKTQTNEEMTRSFQKSLPIFAALAKIGLPVEMPSNADMGRDLITDYSCRDYVLRKSNYIRNEYYSRIDKAMLAQTRVIYLAMRPFLCCSGSSRNTIFAYMPAHKRKNYHFRPWKPEECMKRKQVNYSQSWKSHSLTTNKLKSSNTRIKSSLKFKSL